MGAFHVVSAYFQLGFQVDFRTLAQQQPLGRLPAVRTVRAFGNRDLALVDATGMSACDILEQLRAARVGRGVDDMCRHIGMPTVSEHTYAAHMRLGVLAF